MRATAAKPRVIEPEDVQSDPGKRVFDQRYGAYLVRVMPGGFYATGKVDELIVTVLGSCVAACIRNPFNGFGGMNHFMLPESTSGDWNGSSLALRYGNFAMEALINTILKSGCRRQDLEIKMFGGANLTDGPSMVGSKNVEFARDYLAAEGLKISSEDLGGISGRRIHYNPTTGKVQRLLLQTKSQQFISDSEEKYKKIINTNVIDGGIELFD